MSTKLDLFNKTQIKKDTPEIRPGDIVRVHQKIKEQDEKDLPSDGQGRIQVFEGLVIAIKHGKGVNATFTVRKVSEGIGVERIFPLHSPIIAKIEIVKHSKVRRAKLYYMRQRAGKKARMKTKELLGIDLAKEELKEEKLSEAKSAEETTK